MRLKCRRSVASKPSGPVRGAQCLFRASYSLNLKRAAPALKRNRAGDPDCRKPQNTFRFEERQVEQIRYAYPERSFEKAQAMSELNELLYKNTISPWITAFANSLSAEILKRLPPIRTGNTMFSEKFDPWMGP